MSARSVQLAALLGLGSIVSCQYEATNPSHCVYNGGDAYCRRLFSGFTRPYCVRSFCDELHANAEYGCIEERPDPPSCWSQCGADSMPTEDGLSCVGGPSSFGNDSDLGTTSGSSSTTTATTDASSLGTTDPVTSGAATSDTGEHGDELGLSSSSSAESSSEGDAYDTGAVRCGTSEECSDPAFPFCIDEVCVPCTALAQGADEACYERNPDTPLCSPRGCVQCTPENEAECLREAPVCDPVRYVCMPCTEHSQCGFAGCDLVTGECLDAFVLHVNNNPDAGCDDDNEAGLTSPLCTIARAVEQVNSRRPSTIIVHGPTQNQEYREFRVTSGKAVAILGVPNEGRLPIIEGSDPTRGAMDIQGEDTRVYIEQLSIAGSSGSGISMDGGTLYVDRSEIEDNTGDGITAANGAEVHLHNSFVVINGTPVAENTGIRLSGTSTRATIVYSTIAQNFGLGAGADSLRCEAGAQAELRNSIVIGADSNSINCTLLTAAYNAADQELVGEGNLALGAFQSWWFPRPMDFHVLPGEPFEDVARWVPGDPPTDFDGDPRPMGENEEDYAGADRP